MQDSNVLVWRNCTADLLYFDHAADTSQDGFIVRLGNGLIEVAYDDEIGTVTYRGKQRGEGHYELACLERNGKASLHHFPDSHFIEGYWKEGRIRGMWRIELK